MKLTKNASGKTVVKMSKQEWENIGKTTQWDTALVKKSSLSDAYQEAPVTPDQMKKPTINNPLSQDIQAVQEAMLKVTNRWAKQQLMNVSKGLTQLHQQQQQYEKSGWGDIAPNEPDDHSDWNEAG